MRRKRTKYLTFFFNWIAFLTQRTRPPQNMTHVKTDRIKPITHPPS